MFRGNPRFLGRAFVPRTIRNPADHSAGRLVQPLSSCASGGETQTSGCYGNAGKTSRRKRTAQQGAVAMNCLQATVRKSSNRPKRPIESTGRVPLGKHELANVSQDVMIERQKNIEAGKVSADRPDAALKMHLQQSLSTKSRSRSCV